MIYGPWVLAMGQFRMYPLKAFEFKNLAVVQESLTQVFSEDQIKL
jgi:hypothetical protein